MKKSVICERAQYDYFVVLGYIICEEATQGQRHYFQSGGVGGLIFFGTSHMD